MNGKILFPTELKSLLCVSLRLEYQRMLQERHNNRPPVDPSGGSVWSRPGILECSNRITLQDVLFRIHSNIWRSWIRRKKFNKWKQEEEKRRLITESRSQSFKETRMSVVVAEIEFVRRESTKKGVIVGEGCKRNSIRHYCARIVHTRSCFATWSA